jgi:hypothetical protein
VDLGILVRRLAGRRVLTRKRKVKGEGPLSSRLPTRDGAVPKWALESRSH